MLVILSATAWIGSMRGFLPCGDGGSLRDSRGRPVKESLARSACALASLKRVSLPHSASFLLRLCCSHTTSPAAMQLCGHRNASFGYDQAFAEVRRELRLTPHLGHLVRQHAVGQRTVTRPGRGAKSHEALGCVHRPAARSHMQCCLTHVVDLGRFATRT